MTTTPGLSSQPRHLQTTPAETAASLATSEGTPNHDGMII